MWYNPIMIDMIVHIVLLIIFGLVGYVAGKKTKKKHSSRVHHH